MKQRDAHRRIRRLRKVFALSVLVALSLAGLATYAFYQHNAAVKARIRADYQRDKALTARQQAESGLEFLSHDMRDELKKVGRLDLAAKIQKRVDEYYRQLGTEASQPVALHNQATALDNAGNLALAKGDLAGALASYRQSLAIAERLARQDPGNADWQRDLWVSYMKMATVVEQTGSGDARDWWRKAHDTLAAMKQRGIMLPTDQQYLDQLRQKMGEK